MAATREDSLAVLLLPGRVEGFALEDHARSLLAIPRVVGLEGSGVRPPGLLRTGVVLRQARRLRFPGRVVLLVLYHPAQYPLARALRAHHAGAELWYVEPDALESDRRGELEELREYDALARERATAPLVRTGAVPPQAPSVRDDGLRARLRELDVISPYAFVPAGRRWRAAR